ncbi:MAG: hypothetical protein ABJA34_13765 [Pseudonocardiales bacterium]
MTSLSAVLASLGLASASARMFDPFVVAVFPTLFLLGRFTTHRLTDISIDGWLLVMRRGTQRLSSTLSSWTALRR